MKFRENATQTYRIVYVLLPTERTSCDETYIVVAKMGSYLLIYPFVHLSVITTIILHLYIRLWIHMSLKNSTKLCLMPWTFHLRRATFASPHGKYCVRIATTWLFLTSLKPLKIIKATGKLFCHSLVNIWYPKLLWFLRNMVLNAWFISFI